MFKKIFETPYGPKFIQKRDKEKCIEAYEKTFKRKMVLWRTHAYKFNQVTYNFLGDLGIKIVSDCRRVERNIRTKELAF